MHLGLLKNAITEKKIKIQGTYPLNIQILLDLVPAK